MSHSREHVSPRSLLSILPTLLPILERNGYRTLVGKPRRTSLHTLARPLNAPLTWIPGVCPSGSPTPKQRSSLATSNIRAHVRSRPESECALFSQFFFHVLTCPSRCCLQLVSPPARSVSFCVQTYSLPARSPVDGCSLLLAWSVSFCVLTYTDAVSRD